jgi:hypothetical protein
VFSFVLFHLNLRNTLFFINITMIISSPNSCLGNKFSDESGCLIARELVSNLSLSKLSMEGVHLFEASPNYVELRPPFLSLLIPQFHPLLSPPILVVGYFLRSVQIFRLRLFQKAGSTYSIFGGRVSLLICGNAVSCSLVTRRLAKPA